MTPKWSSYFLMHIISKMVKYFGVSVKQIVIINSSEADLRS